MKKRTKIIIILTIIFVLLVSISFFVFKFNLIDKFKTFTAAIFEDSENLEYIDNENNNSYRYLYEKECEDEFRYETETDKDGNEYTVEYAKKLLIDKRTGEEFEFWESTGESKRICNYTYQGHIEKVEDNKIYFLVDKEDKSDDVELKDVEDYEIIFDLDTFEFFEETTPNYWSDQVVFHYADKSKGSENFQSAEDLDIFIGLDLMVNDVVIEDYYTSDRYRVITFYQF